MGEEKGGVETVCVEYSTIQLLNLTLEDEIRVKSNPKRKKAWTGFGEECEGRKGLDSYKVKDLHFFVVLTRTRTLIKYHLR